MNEHNFKVGDWVITNGYSTTYDGKPLKITGIFGNYCYFNGSKNNSRHNFHVRNARLAHLYQIPKQYYFY